MMKNYYTQKQKDISSTYSNSTNIKQLLQKHQTAPSQSKIFNTRSVTLHPNSIKKTFSKKNQVNPGKFSLSNEFKHHSNKQKQTLNLAVSLNSHAITTPNSNNIKSTLQSTEIRKPLPEFNTEPKHSTNEIMISNTNKNYSKNSSPLYKKRQLNTNINKINTSSHVQVLNTNSNNTPKSTTMSETPKIAQSIKTPEFTLKENKIINEDVGILSNDVFLKKILSMFVSLKPNGEMNTEEKLIKDFYSDSQAKLKELDIKIKSIVINNTIANNVHHRKLSEIFVGSQTRMEIYKTYFDFIFKILNEIKILATTEINQSLILKQIDEVNSNTKLTNTCNIEDSQLEEKSHMIVPVGNVDLNENITNVNNSFSEFISSINSDFYQKIIYDDYENHIYSNNNSFEISKSNSTYKKVSPNNINSTRRMNIKMKGGNENMKVNQLDVTPVQFAPRKQSFMSSDKTIKMNDTDDSEIYAQKGNEKINTANKPLPIVNNIINKVRKENLYKKSFSKMHPNQIITKANEIKNSAVKSSNIKNKQIKTGEVKKIAMKTVEQRQRPKLKNPILKKDDNNCFIF